jgi:hypothetical protein
MPERSVKELDQMKWARLCRSCLSVFGALTLLLKTSRRDTINAALRWYSRSSRSHCC